MNLIKTAHPHRYLQETPRTKTADTSIYSYHAFHIEVFLYYVLS